MLDTRPFFVKKIATNILDLSNQFLDDIFCLLF